MDRHPGNLDASAAHATAVAASCHVVAVPYPGRGHINPMMCLCHLLAAHGAIVTFVVTEEWLALLHAADAVPPPAAVRLRTIPNVIPSEAGRAADFPSFLDAVYTRMGDPFERLLDELDFPPAAIIADSYLSWAVAAGNRRGIPVALLVTISSAAFSVLYHFDRIPSHLLSPEAVSDHVAGEEFLAQWVPGLISFRLADVKSISMAKTLKRALESVCWVPKAQIILFTSFYELGARVIDSLRSELSCPVYSVGPCIPYMMPQVNKSIPCSGNDVDYFSWLDSQKERSVLYVSLGSFLSVLESQMEEIAMGLRASETKFLWVARGNSPRMQEVCGKSGFVVPWCDQLRVLQHPSVGGFLTHCGWNSILEAIFAGVPMLTFPIAWDQPLNSRLVVDEWKIGLSLKEKLQKDDIVGRDDIAMLVKRLMDSNGGVESTEMRRRARELQTASLKANQEGGSSHSSIISFLKGLCSAKTE